MKATLYAIIAALLVLIGFWLTGFDFNERGEKAFACYATVVWFSSIAFVLGRYNESNS